MSHQLIAHSPDLKRLQDEGYDIEVRSGYLLVKHVPYVNSNKGVEYGTLVSVLNVANNITIKPENHVVHFVGDHPCNKDGSKMDKITNASQQKQLANDLVIHHSFSSKPVDGDYPNYYEKMTAYVNMICSQAQSINPDVTAKTFPVIETTPEESVFKYIDTASSKAEIVLVASKLELGKIAIVGLGGTGAYVLDLIAKTPVKEIHLFDGDKFSQHNAFRSPGAPSGDELKQEPKKVNYYKDQYSKMRWNVFANDFYIDSSNVDRLREMAFVFLCLDRAEPKKIIIEALEESGVSFIDVGMGIIHVNGALQGILRITTSTANTRNHAKGCISFGDGDNNDEYASNIQVADLNALNAALAVIKWKKLFGFYHDTKNEYHTTYTLDGNMLLNDDLP